MVLQRNRAVGVKRNVTTNPSIFGEIHFGLTAPTTISGISTCSRPKETGRSGAVSSTRSCCGWVFGLASFKTGQIGELEETPGLSPGAWQMRPLSSGYVEAKSSRPGDEPAIMTAPPIRRSQHGTPRLAARQYIGRLGEELEQ
jgi:hypothetical protein